MDEQPKRAISTYQTDSRAARLVTGTVNSWTRGEVAASEIAEWIRAEDDSAARQRVALSSFFLEVPVEVQIAFLLEHELDEDKALRSRSALSI